MMSIFSCAYWPSVCLFWRDVCFILPHYSVGLLLLSCVSCLVIFEIKILLLTLFANVLFQSLYCLLCLFIISFAMQKLISLILPREANLRKYIGIIYVRDCFAYFLFRSFMMLCLIFVFKPFWVYLCVCVVRVCSNFIDLHATVQFSQHHLLKWLPLWKINWP